MTPISQATAANIDARRGLPRAKVRPLAAISLSHMLMTQHAVLRCGDFDQPPRIVIAIPVCNESERITACVGALAQTLADYPQSGIVLMVNNSADASAVTAFRAMQALGLTGIVVDATFGAEIATAGWARRMALEIAAGWAHPDAVLMTTDADSRVAPDWAEANLDLLAQGAHLVCGRIAADPVEAARLPKSIAQSDALESTYTALSIELDARLDPRPHNPWPHHGLASGASLAIRAADYRAIGGMPPLPCSEDRAFAALVERHDLCVRHSDAPLVTVSCRLDGRACGGMADAITARIADQNSFADQRLLPAEITARRAMLRKALRAAWETKGDIGRLLCDFDVTYKKTQKKHADKTFGAFWASIEDSTKTLSALRMRPSDLARELPALRQLVAQARLAP
ncbi:MULTISPECIES: glycosyltransferase family A protein [unclassified Yoonia]|uniref:glycosyltransferase n=1 Tax=unclassified Yoonia TaxID=2629118 RepID=UPI002B001B8C|nr:MULTISPECIES: glycosyltransferase family A protein [unclassified Yoonia]